jgi:hypothetical protein
MDILISTNITVFPLSASFFLILLYESVAIIDISPKVLMLDIHFGFVPYTYCWSISLTIMLSSCTDRLAQFAHNTFLSMIVILAAFIIELVLQIHAPLCHFVGVCQVQSNLILNSDLRISWRKDMFSPELSKRMLLTLRFIYFCTSFNH